MAAEWETDSGLVEKFDGKVVDAWFEEGEYGVTLKLAVESPQIEGDTELWFSCGKKGVEFVSEKQVDISLAKNGRFNDNTGIGILIKEMKKHPDVLGQVSAKGGPDEATSFVGLTCRWERTQFGENQDGKARYVTVPVGPAGGEAKPADEKPEAEIPEWLVQVCVAAATYDEFVENALAHDNIDRATRKLVMDESLWQF